MNITTLLTPPFLQRLRAVFVSNHETNRGLYVASTDVEPGYRFHLVLSAMRRNAADMRRALLTMMQDHTRPLIECATAAKLHREGWLLGYWAGTPAEAAMGQGLITAAFGEPATKPAAKEAPKAAPATAPPPSPPPVAASAAPSPKRRPHMGDAEVQKCLAIMREDMRLRHALKTETSEGKLKAIQNYFAALTFLGASEWLAQQKEQPQ